jgi:glycerol kinase
MKITPHEGWLEHDPIEILQNVEDTMADVKNQLKGE